MMYLHPYFGFNISSTLQNGTFLRPNVTNEDSTKKHRHDGDVFDYACSSTSRPTRTVSRAITSSSFVGMMMTLTGECG